MPTGEEILVNNEPKVRPLIIDMWVAAHISDISRACTKAMIHDLKTKKITTAAVKPSSQPPSNP